MSEWKEYKEIEHYSWSKWTAFPDPRKGEYLYAPYGCGVYQLRNKKTKQYILFGTGKNVAFRMSSILPEPHGSGRRNNNEKRQYTLNNINDIEYRTVSFLLKSEMICCEKGIKALNVHLFNT